MFKAIANTSKTTLFFRLRILATFFFKTNSSENKNIATKELIASKTSILFKSFCMSADTYPVHTPANFWIPIGEPMVIESQQWSMSFFPVELQFASSRSCFFLSESSCICSLTKTTLTHYYSFSIIINNR